MSTRYVSTDSPYASQIRSQVPPAVGATILRPPEEFLPYLQNDPIDRRLGRGSPHRGRLYRGKLIKKSSRGRALGKLHFLFNPTKIDFSYTIDPETRLAEDELMQQGQAYLGPATTCNFQLVFDRTYEVLDADARGKSNPGVLQDVVTLEHLMGITRDGEIIGSPGTTTVDVYFGQENTLKFGGYFTGASVSMTHFTPKMIPIRLIMSISLKRTREIDRTFEGAKGDPWNRQEFPAPPPPPKPPSEPSESASAQLYSSATPSYNASAQLYSSATPTYRGSTGGGGGGFRLL